jgi:hypothetical protein
MLSAIRGEFNRIEQMLHTKDGLLLLIMGEIMIALRNIAARRRSSARK